MNNIFSILIVALSVTVSTACYSESEVEGLSPELRTLLKQEMRAI